jgi:hypothetical protein
MLLNCVNLLCFIEKVKNILYDDDASNQINYLFLQDGNSNGRWIE